MNHWKTIALAALTLVVLTVLFLQPGHRPDFSDTEVYRGGGVKALAHQTVYDVKGHYTFNYPPFAAVFYALTLAQLPFQTAAWTFYFLSALLWLILIALVIREIQKVFPVKKWTETLVLWTAFGLFFGMGLRDEMKLGQTMIVPFFAVFAAHLLYTRKPSGRGSAFLFKLCAALLLSFAIQIKIYFAVLIPVFFFRGDWFFVALVFLGHFFYNGLLLSLFHGFSFAVDENVRWFRALLTSSGNLLANQWNTSVMGILAKYGVSKIAVQAAGLAVIFGTLAVQWFTRKQMLFWQIGVSLALVVLVNPIAWPYWMLLGFPLLLWNTAALTRGFMADSPERTREWALLAFYFICANLQNTGAVRLGALTWGTFIFVAYSVFLERQRSLKKI